MQHALVVKPQRQVSIAPHLAGEDEHVSGAVHRFDPERLAFGLHEEHIVPEDLPMPGGLPQLLIEDERGTQLHVAGWRQYRPHVLREQVPQAGALRKPERRARGPGVEREQPQLAAELAVVAFLRLFQARQVGFERAFGKEGRAVNPLHRLVTRIALPVGIGARQHLEGFQLAGRRDVRSPAKIDEQVVDRVAGDDGAALFLDQLAP